MNLINKDQMQRQRWNDDHKETVFSHWGKIIVAVVLTILLEVLVARI
jgi:hypothetical protein